MKSKTEEKKQERSAIYLVMALVIIALVFVAIFTAIKDSKNITI